MVAGWVVLPLAWWRVIARGDGPTPAMVAVPLVLAVVTLATTSWWVRHNRGIYQEKGPRRAVPASALPYVADRRGRPLHFDKVQLRRAQSVVVVVGDDGAKRYHVMPR